jgi:hypothetical protein
MNGCERARVYAAGILLCAAVAACGGGGGGATTAPPTSEPTATPPASKTITASGIVVDDANGSPLSGVRVVLMPWAPCGPTPAPASITPEADGCPTPLPSPQSTSNAQGKFTLGNVPNGHYLLVIGNDSTSTSGTIQATVHDNVTLKGGAQTLTAPTIPPVPTITPHPWETNGDYRLAALNATTEVPCFQDWEAARANNGLSASSVDEWLLEDVREITLAVQNGAADGVKYLTTGDVGLSGGSSCNEMIDIAFGDFGTGANYPSDPRTLWFAGEYLPYAGGAVNAQGNAEFPIDPRSFVDPNIPVWL